MSGTTPTASGRLIPSLTLVALAAALVALAARLDSNSIPVRLKVEDFGAYWTAAYLNRTGGNPYSPDDLRPLQQQIDPSRTHILLMRCPPATLALFAPFTLFDFAGALLLWTVTQVGLLLWCAGKLWEMYGGPAEKRWLAWVLTLTFYPTLQLLGLGQVSGLLLLGVVGFVLLEKSHGFWAGAVLALGTVKPQLLFPLGIVLLLWCVQRRRWAVLVGGATAVGLTTLAAWLANSQVIEQYVFMWRHHPPDRWVPPTLGSLLRRIMGEQMFWLSFLPPGAGAAWALWYYGRHRRDWDWRERLPPLMLACYLSTAYGWVYDVVILLPPLLRAAVWALRSRPAFRAILLGTHLAATAVAVAMHRAGFEEYLFFWIAPFVLVSYLGLGWGFGHEESPAEARA